MGKNRHLWYPPILGFRAAPGGSWRLQAAPGGHRWGVLYAEKMKEKQYAAMVTMAKGRFMDVYEG